MTININTVDSRLPNGIYVVPSELIMHTKHYLPAVYVAAMRFTNRRNEVVASIALLLDYLSIAPNDKLDGSNQQVRRALHTMRTKHIIYKPSFGFDKSAPRIRDAFKFTFSKGFGWDPAKHLAAGYVKEAEIEKLIKGAKRHSIGMVESVPNMLHALLYCRMIMEKPGGAKTMKTAEQQAIGVVLEKDIRDVLGLSSDLLMRTFRALQRHRIIDFRRRIVREKPSSPPMKIYVITNYFPGHMKLIEQGLSSLDKIFASCEFIADTQIAEDSFAKEARKAEKDRITFADEVTEEFLEDIVEEGW